MQHLVDKLYTMKKTDKFKRISRFEFEQRDIRTKLDLADIYLQLEQIKITLKANKMDIPEFEQHEKAILEMVEEERKEFSKDMEELKQKAKQEGNAFSRYLKNIKAPSFPAKKEKIVVEVEPAPAQEAAIRTILSEQEVTDAPPGSVLL